MRQPNDGYRQGVVGLWSKGEAAVLAVCLLAEVAGIVLVVSRVSVTAGALLVLVAAACQLVVALRFRGRRKANGSWNTNRA